MTQYECTKPLLYLLCSGLAIQKENCVLAVVILLRNALHVETGIGLFHLDIVGER